MGDGCANRQRTECDESGTSNGGRVRNLVQGVPSRVRHVHDGLRRAADLLVPRCGRNLVQDVGESLELGRVRIGKSNDAATERTLKLSLTLAVCVGFDVRRLSLTLGVGICSRSVVGALAVEGDFTQPQAFSESDLGVLGLLLSACKATRLRIDKLTARVLANAGSLRSLALGALQCLGRRNETLGFLGLGPDSGCRLLPSPHGGRRNAREGALKALADRVQFLAGCTSGFHRLDDSRLKLAHLRDRLARIGTDLNVVRHVHHLKSRGHRPSDKSRPGSAQKNALILWLPL